MPTQWWGFVLLSQPGLLSAGMAHTGFIQHKAQWPGRMSNHVPTVDINSSNDTGIIL